LCAHAIALCLFRHTHNTLGLASVFAPPPRDAISRIRRFSKEQENTITQGT
jgi:hypothetical protein